ncbi:MAG: cobalamin biosynthesis protein CobW [Lachnospiraceae bacterium]|nr:cobalamin biosynthesis protein CobW [Lachnospiraceae bacterium]
MTKIDVVSGFLGAGKTTLIKKLLKEALDGGKVVLIENEFGEIGIDGGFLKESGIEIKEMNSGCICCSLVGDFGTSLKEVLTTYSPERVLIEPSGVGKLSDVLKAVEDVAQDLDVEVNSAVAVVDASKCKMYMKNFGEFFINQVEYAGTIILTRADKTSQEKMNACVEMLREHNDKATIITTPLDQLDGKTVLETIEGADKLEDMMKEMLEHVHEEHDENCTCGCHDHHHHHHHDHDEHDEECTCGCHDHGHEHHHDHDDHDHEHHHDHHHDHDDHDHEHHHDHDDHDHEHHHDHDDHDHEHHHDHDHDHEHHHDHDDHDHDYHHDHDDHDHEHHHDHDEHCTCGCHDHDHHHHDHHGHHHADEVFTSWGMETPNTYTAERMEEILTALDSGEYGVILRAKGMVPAGDGTWVYYDYVPEEHDIREGKPAVTGKICVIGSNLAEDKLAELFGK